MDVDVLHNIRDNDLWALQNIYRTQLPRLAYLYSGLGFIIALKKQNLHVARVDIMAPKGNWNNGTFLATIRYEKCTEIFMYSKESNCADLCEALLQTKKINWKTDTIIFYGLHGDLYPSVSQALKQIPFELNFVNECFIWRLPREVSLGLHIKCPPNTYIDQLQPRHAIIINSTWPLKFENSEYYIRNLIEAFGGWGLFLQSNGLLVSWVVGSCFGMCVMGTLEEYQGRGYAQTVIQQFSKHIGKMGFDPSGATAKDNIVSQRVLSRIGFVEEDLLYYTLNVNLTCMQT